MEKRTPKDWIIAVRPWSFTASVIPIITTLAYAFHLNHNYGLPADWLTGLLTLPLIMLLHAGGNVVSDYYDHIRGIDRLGSLNGVRYMQEGTFAPATVLKYGYLLLACGAVLGLTIVWLSGDARLLLFGLAGIALPLLYPWLKAHALGDIDILLCFALLPSVGVMLATTGHYHFEAMLYSLPYGLLTISILHANNTRDIASDRQAGLTTFCGIIGWRASQTVYAALLTTPYLLVALFAALRLLPAWILITLLTLPIAIKNITIMMKGRADDITTIATLDHHSAMLQMVFGLLYTLGILI